MFFSSEHLAKPAAPAPSDCLANNFLSEQNCRGAKGYILLILKDIGKGSHGERECTGCRSLGPSLHNSEILDSLLTFCVTHSNSSLAMQLVLLLAFWDPSRGISSSAMQNAREPANGSFPVRE